MKKIFVIQPVRNVTEDKKKNIENYVWQLEQKGYNVYLPYRDTDQNDNIGYRICTDNKRGLLEADEVHIYYDKNSIGSVFDLGMAFASGKKLVIINRHDLEFTEGKSFSNMISKWETTNEN